MMHDFSEKPVGARSESRFQLGRRKLLLASLAVPFVWTQGAHAQGVSFSHFLALSSRLSGYSNLDQQLGLKIYQSLSKMLPSFDNAVASLASVDESALGQSPVVKAILQAWYLGVVGSGEQSTCIAYVSTLQARVVADVLRPPTYAYGPYGSWRTQPIPA